MRITELHAEGFGILDDVRVDGFGDGLTVVTGGNGAGKSSLQALIVRVLYGFPRAGAEGVRHLEPRGPGVHGGTVTLADASGGVWSVTRVKGAGRRRALTVVGPDGVEVHDEAALKPLVHNLSAEQFTSLFAIDLQELTSSVGLEGDRLRTELYELTVLGNLGSLDAAADEAARRAAALLSTSGNAKHPTVNGALQEVRALDKQLRTARTDARQVGELRRAMDAAGPAVTALREELAGLQAERRRLERIAAAWPHHLEASAARVRAADVDGPAIIEAQRGAATAARSARDGAQARHDELAAVVDELALQRDRVEVNEAVLDAAEQLRGLNRAMGGFEFTVQDREAATGERQRARDAADEALTAAGTGWDDVAVAAMTADGATLRRLEVAVDAVQEATEQRRAREQQLEQATVAHAVRVEELATERRQLGPEPDAQRLTALGAAVHTVEKLAPVVEGARLQQAADPGGGAGPERALPIIAIALLLLALVLAIAVLVLDPPVTALLAILAASAAAVGGLLLGRRRRAVTIPIGLDRATLQGHRAQLDEAFGVLGLTTTTVQPAALAHARTQYEQGLRAIADWRSMDQRLARMQEAHAAAETARTAAADALAAAVEQQATASATLEQVATELGVGGRSETPDGLVSLVEHLAHAKVALGVVARLDERIRVADTAIATQLRSAAELAEVLGRTPPTTAELPGFVEALRTELEAGLAAAQRRAQLGEEIERRREEQQAQAAALSAATASLRELASRNGLDDASDVVWDAAIAADDERAAASAVADEEEQAVRRLIGDDDAAWALLVAAEPAAWEDQLAPLDERIAALDDRIAARNRQLGVDTERFAQLGGDQTISRCEQQIADLRAVVEEATRRWLVLRLAEEQLRAARTRYEAEQQPKVLIDAGALLRAFTAGALSDVDVDDQGIVAINAAGEHIDPVDLSTGERMQLYLALRVALADNLAGRLPLLLDDVLVGADDDRSDAIVRTLAVLAGGRQVVLFTPSRRTVDAALAAVDDVAVIELHAGKVVGTRT